jgi:hypothetical protein
VRTEIALETALHLALEFSLEIPFLVMTDRNERIFDACTFRDSYNCQDSLAGT